MGNETSERTADKLLISLFRDALMVVEPARCVPLHIPQSLPTGRIAVVGAGKASAAMARAVEATAREGGWLERIEGVVVTRYGHAVDCERIDIVEASHPVPDAAGKAAAQRILDLARSLDRDDLLLCLISGGGSALLTLPAEGVSEDDKAQVTRALLKSGAPIGAMNTVRKHISAIKGGRLAEAAAPARVVSLLLSDVPGDDPSVIASGPTVPDATTCADALAALERYGVEPPRAVRDLLESGRGETPKPGDAAFKRCETVMIARPKDMLDAAARSARDKGIETRILGDDLEGEARDLGREHAVLALKLSRDPSVAKPCLVLSGGETTVTVRGEGRGGRNAEYALGLALALDGAPGISAIACHSDGIDGVEDNAGVVVLPDTLARARAAGRSPEADLAGNDSYSLFEAVGGLVMTGPTLTNVNDFRAILVED